MRKLLSYYRPMRIYDYINSWSGIQVKGGRSTYCVFDTILCVDTRYIGLLLVRQRPAAEHARSKVYDLLTTSPMASIRSDSRRTHWRNSRESLGFASDSLVIHGNFRSWFARGSLAYDAWKELVTRAVLYYTMEFSIYSIWRFRLSGQLTLVGRSTAVIAAQWHCSSSAFDMITTYI